MGMQKKKISVVICFAFVIHISKVWTFLAVHICSSGWPSSAFQFTRRNTSVLEITESLCWDVKLQKSVSQSR